MDRNNPSGGPPNGGANGRLHLNFGYDQQQPYSNNPQSSRAYPTTPSTFPQPMYAGQGNQEFVDAQQNAYNQGYFVNNPYMAPAGQTLQQQQQQQYAPAPHGSAPPTGYQQQRGGHQGNDETSGLIQQFSNQDLSASPRPARVAPQGGQQRPRTAGSPAGHHQQAAAHLTPPMPARGANPEDEELVRCPERYSENAHKRGKAAKELVNVFFRENIERARDRNMRYAIKGPRPSTVLCCFILT